MCTTTDGADGFVVCNDNSFPNFLQLLIFVSQINLFQLLFLNFSWYCSFSQDEKLFKKFLLYSIEHYFHYLLCHVSTFKENKDQRLVDID